MTKKISTNLTPDNVAQILQLLTDTPGRLTQLSQLLPPDQLTRPLAPAERSFAENVAHLLHCEARTSEGITLALLTHEPPFPAFHPERQFGQLWRFNEWPPADLLTYFHLRRMMLLKVLHKLTPAEWARAIQPAGKKRTESVYWLVRGQALHETEHLADLTHHLQP